MGLALFWAPGFLASNQVCFKCMATRGNHDFELCYTNVALDAAWRANPGAMYNIAPAMATLHGFSENLVALDLLHLMHLGVGRDLAGTALKLICKGREYYSGRNIAKRLQQCYCEMKLWLQLRAVPMSLKKLKKETLGWSAQQCPVLKVKGADTIAVLRFVDYKFQSQAPRAYPGIVACIWSAVNLVGCLASSSLFLEESERASAYELGQFFIRSYVTLAGESVAKGEFYFKIRPKMHFLLHLVEGLNKPGRCRNPFYDATFVDEDLVKQVLVVKKKCSIRTASHNVLRRFCVVNKAALRNCAR